MVVSYQREKERGRDNCGSGRLGDGMTPRAAAGVSLRSALARANTDHNGDRCLSSDRRSPRVLFFPWAKAFLFFRPRRDAAPLHVSFCGPRCPPARIISPPGRSSRDVAEDRDGERPANLSLARRGTRGRARARARWKSEISSRGET